MDLSRNLGLGSIAEGIETAEQAERLRELGCGYGQGFHFCRPLEGDAMTSRLIAEAAECAGWHNDASRAGFDVR